MLDEIFNEGRASLRDCSKTVWQAGPADMTGYSELRMGPQGSNNISLDSPMFEFIAAVL